MTAQATARPAPSIAERVNGALRRVPVWPVYVVGALPPLWFLYLGLTGGLGVEPIKELEHRLGELGLQVLIAALAVTPLRRFTGISLLRFRRAIGLIAFYYIACHLLVWLVLDIQRPRADLAGHRQAPLHHHRDGGVRAADPAGRDLEQLVGPEAGRQGVEAGALAGLSGDNSGRGALRDAGEGVADRADAVPRRDSRAARGANPGEAARGPGLRRLNRGPDAPRVWG